MANKGYWVICLNGYEIDSIEIKKGQMDYYTSTWPITNTDWRRATQSEIDNKQYMKGKAYLPPALWTF